MAFIIFLVKAQLVLSVISAKQIVRLNKIYSSILSLLCYEYLLMVFEGFVRLINLGLCSKFLSIVKENARVCSSAFCVFGYLLSERCLIPLFFDSV